MREVVYNISNRDLRRDYIHQELDRSVVLKLFIIPWVTVTLQIFRLLADPFGLITINIWETVLCCYNSY